MNIKTDSSGKVRILHVGIGLTILLVIAAALLLPPLFRPVIRKSVDRGAAAFGKLPPAGTSAGAAALEARPAIGMPIGRGLWETRFEYSWTGGAWPVLLDNLAVYRRTAGEISITEAKDLAAKFGLTGEPQANTPVPPMAPAGGSAPTPFKSYNFYDQPSGKRLEISATDGRFSYMVEGAWQTVEKNPGGRPSESRAKEIAVSFLRDKGLLPGDYTGPFTGQNGVVSTGAVAPGGAGAPAPVEEPKVIQPAYLEIQFGKKLGSYDLVEPTGEPSRYIASVTVGPDNAIMAASGEIPGILEESAYPLMGPAAAFEEIKKNRYGGVRALGAPVPLMSAPADTPVESPAGQGGQGTAAAEPGAISGSTGSAEPGRPPVEPPNPAPEPSLKPEPIKVEFDKVELAYMFVTGADGVGYYQPAYIFSGRMGAGAGRSAYAVAVPAVADKYIKR